MLTLEQVIERLNKPDPKHKSRFAVCAEHVAPKLRMHPETMRRIRKGQHTPNWRTLKKLSDYLGGEL